MADVSNARQVWVFLVERGVTSGSDLQLFWTQADAVEAARGYLSASSPGEEPVLSGDVYELIESANQQVESEEYLLVAPFPIA